jgi:hypothetical protein
MIGRNGGAGHGMSSLQNDRHVALTILIHALCWQIVEGEAVFDVVIGGVSVPSEFGLARVKPALVDSVAGDEQCTRTAGKLGHTCHSWKKERQ